MKEKRERKELRYICEECGQRIRNTQRIVWNAKNYHEKCMELRSREETKRKNKKAAADNKEYYRLLRKQWGIVDK